MTRRMSSELVALLWLKGVTGINPDTVATVVPRDNTTWAPSGFVHVAGVLNDQVDGGTRLHTVTVSLQLLGANLDSGKPPWGKTADLGMLISEGCEQDNCQRGVTKTGFVSCQVKNAEATGPVRVPGDEGSFARYSQTLTLWWQQLLE